MSSPGWKSCRKADFKSTWNYWRERLGRREQTHKTRQDEAIKVSGERKVMFINCLVTCLPIGPHLFFERGQKIKIKNHSVCFCSFFSGGVRGSCIRSCHPEPRVDVDVGSHVQQQAQSLQRKKNVCIFSAEPPSSTQRHVAVCSPSHPLHVGHVNYLKFWIDPTHRHLWAKPLLKK